MPNWSTEAFDQFLCFSIQEAHHDVKEKPEYDYTDQFELNVQQLQESIINNIWILELWDYERSNYIKKAKRELITSLKSIDRSINGIEKKSLVDISHIILCAWQGEKEMFQTLLDLDLILNNLINNEYFIFEMSIIDNENKILENGDKQIISLLILKLTQEANKFDVTVKPNLSLDIVIRRLIYWNTMKRGANLILVRNIDTILKETLKTIETNSELTNVQSDITIRLEKGKYKKRNLIWC